MNNQNERKYELKINQDKCIGCGMCQNSCQAEAIEGQEKEKRKINNEKCVSCGQCVQTCPMKAIEEKNYIEEVKQKLEDENTIVIAQTAPSLRTSIGEEFGMTIGTNCEGKMVSALRKLGFNKVFDINTGADFTVIEEANEFIQRLQKKHELPMITSCCPGWIKYVEINYPELLPHISTCKSPHEMLGTLIKTYYADLEKIDARDIYVVSVMPCIAKKYERQREQLKYNDYYNVDAVLTTREFANLIKEKQIDFNNLSDEEFDNPIGKSTGAAAIFGTSGGVMEAALRTAQEALTGEKLEKINFEQMRVDSQIKKATVNINGKDINIVVVSGLKNAKQILEEIKNGKVDYQFVEVMTCPGGCIMGGGQPIHNFKTKNEYDIRKLRSNILYSIDEKSEVRKSHENPVTRKIYKDLLKTPGSKIAHELLHTTYNIQSKIK